MGAVSPARARCHAAVFRAVAPSSVRRSVPTASAARRRRRAAPRSAGRGRGGRRGALGEPREGYAAAPPAHRPHRRLPQRVRRLPPQRTPGGPYEVGVDGGHPVLQLGGEPHRGGRVRHRRRAARRRRPRPAGCRPGRARCAPARPGGPGARRTPPRASRCAGRRRSGRRPPRSRTRRRARRRARPAPPSALVAGGVRAGPFGCHARPFEVCVLRHARLRSAGTRGRRRTAATEASSRASSGGAVEQRLGAGVGGPALGGGECRRAASASSPGTAGPGAGRGRAGE